MPKLNLTGDTESDSLLSEDTFALLAGDVAGSVGGETFEVVPNVAFGVGSAPL